MRLAVIPDAARLSGINIRRHLLAVFCVMGALSGVAAIIYTARVGSASPDAGQLLELDAIAACVIGGTSLMGGRGTVFGAILGALIMASLDNGMSLKNVEPYMQNIIKGAILVAAVGLDMAGRNLGSTPPRSHSRPQWEDPPPSQTTNSPTVPMPDVQPDRPARLVARQQ